MRDTARRTLAALSGASVHLTTSAVCFACLVDDQILDRDASLAVIGVTMAQPCIGVLQHFYAESLRAGRTARERVRHFGRQGLLILLCFAVFAGPFLTIPEAAIGVAWALAGVLISLFGAGGDIERESRRATALAEDAVDLFGLVLRVGLVVGLIIVFTAAALKVQEGPPMSLFALVPACYFALLAMSVFHVHGAAFEQSPTSLSRLPMLRWLIEVGQRKPSQRRKRRPGFYWSSRS